ncbi:ATP-binding protein [Tabrizicola flagellatus]|uniref:ATP-binding protein n=1 Tax=Tabrizicola flagellatus TaxID=2593021 RepID=UPI00190F991A|nr:ATP-binding protein [Tabrizicola flagellatus]
MMDPDQLTRLVNELRRLPAETPWVEFKENNGDPQTIGELIAALSNAATLNGKETAWLVWGIEDGSHAIVGTDFVPSSSKKGNQDLESWLVQMLSPRLHIRFHSGEVGGQSIVVLEVPAARGQPTAFSGKELVRVGSTNRSLRDVPQMERDLWRSFDVTPFERQLAVADKGGEDVLKLLEYPAYFELRKLPLPGESSKILLALADEDFIRRNDAGHWDITNLGAILFARDLTQFPTVARKAVRLIVYRGKGRMQTEREQEGRKGYAVGFERLMEYLKALLPRNEVVGTALRQEVAMYPDLALRELIANALIHQDFTITGSGPMVEVFEDRVEITNPGVPLGDIDRLLDQAPRSRNEALAAFMRRIGVCEERGSGVDKVVNETEVYQLPPPRWETSGGAARAVLFAHKDFRDMDRADRVHACYLHACLKYVMREEMTNTSLRERFGFDEKNSSMASRIIRDALDEGVIKPYDPEQGKRNARYIPAWA